MGSATSGVNSNLSSDSVQVITAPEKQTIKATVASTTPIPLEVKKLETSASSDMQQQGSRSSTTTNAVRKESASSFSATSGVNSNLSSDIVQVITAPMKQTIKATVAANTPIPVNVKKLETSAHSNMHQQGSSSSISSNAVRRESASSSSATSGVRDLVNSDPMLVPSIFPRRSEMFGITNTNLDAEIGEDFFSDRFMKRLGHEMDKQIICSKDDEGKFELSLNTHGFKPDEIKVKVAGGILVVEAMHAEKGDNKHMQRQFSRKYTLPEGCEAAMVNSNLSSDGVLIITAPKRQAIKAAGTVNTPIPVEVK